MVFSFQVIFLGGIGVYFPTCYHKLDPGRFVELFVYYSSVMPLEELKTVNRKLLITDVQCHMRTSDIMFFQG